MVHAKLSPSNKRWAYCPGSIREEAKYINTSGKTAIDGTGSHKLLENCIENSVPTGFYLGQLIGVGNYSKAEGWLVDQDRCDRVQMALDYIERRKQELTEQFPQCTVTVESESRSNPGIFFERNDWWGTCDITIKATDIDNNLKYLEIADYKDGFGYVSEKWNTQLIAYLFGKLVEKDKITVPDIDMRMTIIQPKTGTPIRYMCTSNPDHGFSKESLMLKVLWLNEQAIKTDMPDAPLIAGDHCEWCKHNPKRNGSCTVAIEESTTALIELTSDLNKINSDNILNLMIKAVANRKNLSVEELSKIADIEAGFSAVFSSVKEEIQSRIESGVSVPGYAMVPGNSKKIWNESEEIIAKKLKSKKLKKDEIYPSKLISPGAVLKLSNLTAIQKKKIKEELISEVAGNNRLKKVEYEKKDIITMFETAETVSFL